MEFTPIGYIKGKQSSTTTTTTQPNLSPRKLDLNNLSRSRIDDDTQDELGPLRKQRRVDENGANDNNTSGRLFNDASQFDDTIPELQNNNKTANIQTTTTNNNILPPELNSNTHDIISNDNISNPIKQQQKRIETLVRTVTMLKMKNDVLINILKQDDPNKLDTNLKLIDDLSKEKDKNNILTKNNNSLQIEINNLKDQLLNTTKDEDTTTTTVNKNLIKEQSILKSQLESNKLEIQNLNNQIISLQNDLEQKNLKNDNDTLNNQKLNDEKLLNLETKITKLSQSENKHLQEIKSLNLKLKQSQDDLKSKEIKFNNQLKDLQDEKSTLKDQLQSEINQYKSEIESLNLEINQFQNNISNQDDLINKQNETKIKLIECQKNLDDKIHEFKEVQAVLRNKEKLLKELEIKNSDLSKTIDQLTLNYKNALKEKKLKIDTLNADLENYQIRYDNEIKNQNDYIDEINSLKNKINELTEIISTHKDELNNINSKDNYVQEANDKLRNEISNLENEILNYKDTINQLKDEIYQNGNDLQNEKELNVEKDRKIVSLQKQLDDLETQFSTKTNIVSEKEKELARLIRQSNQFNDEKTHLNEEIKFYKDKLIKSNERIKSLENQLFQATIKTSDETLNIINTKNNEIQTLKDELNKITKELDKTLKTNNLIESKLSRKHQTKIKDLQDEIKLLNDMLGSKNDEYETSIRKLNDEIDDWRQRYNSLNDTLQRQLEEAQQSSTASSSQRGRQTNEIDQLMQNRSDLLNHIDKLEKNLRSLQNDNDDLKTENNKIKQSHSKLSDGMSKLLNKYRERKTEFNNKLIDLENENIRLERLIENERFNNITRQNELNSMSNLDNNSLQKDIIEYYKLRFYNEVTNNNDLKVQNEYYKNVLNATLEQIKLDSRRIKRELNPISSPTFGFDTNNDYQNDEFNRYDRPYSSTSVPFNNLPARYSTPEVRYALLRKCKIKAKLVFACVRFNRLAGQHDKYSKRINYLKRRIENQREMNRDDRYSW